MGPKQHLRTVCRLHYKDSSYGDLKRALTELIDEICADDEPSPDNYDLKSLIYLSLKAIK